MRFRGTLSLNGNIVAHQVDGELKEVINRDGKPVYRGFFSTSEQGEFSFDEIYRLDVQDNMRTKIKILDLLSDLGGLRVFSCYATQSLHQ
ncbi:MAG TPA: hypothetical protein PLX97_06840 [Gemmatales bacterium]|nr:hypothetical protein [Gemmatales bacterium]